MFKIIWTFAYIMHGQPITQNMLDAEKFKTVAECRAYGEAYRGRYEDWGRGVLKAHWDFPIVTDYRCEAEDRPA